MTKPSLNRIQLVEDENDIRIVAKMALETVGGFAINACSSGQKALEQVHLQQPELILLDVMMPGMDGFAVLQALRKHPETMHIPVVFLTAKVHRHEVRKLIDSGATDVIHKPFDPMTLAEQVAAIWDKIHD
jgi:CheY-like chemotaxis protein